jgi:tetratricopeptide (TPR) repeat protein
VSDPASQVDPLVNETSALLAARKYDLAMQRARDAARLDPRDPRPHLQLSQALFSLERFKDALDEADEAIALDPNSAVGYRLKSLATATMARRETSGDRLTLGHAAVDAAREAVRLQPREPSGYGVLAQALTTIYAQIEADATVQELIALAPQQASTWVTTSFVALEGKHWDVCIDASRKALRLDPNNYSALNNLGVALRASGHKREAADVLAQAIRVNPDATIARRNLSHSGIRIARVAILVALIPLGLIAHVGFTLYALFAFASNIWLSKDKKLALRLERWTVPIAMRFAKPAKDRRLLARDGRGMDTTG